MNGENFFSPLGFDDKVGFARQGEINFILGVRGLVIVGASVQIIDSASQIIGLNKLNPTIGRLSGPFSQSVDIKSLSVHFVSLRSLFFSDFVRIMSIYTKTPSP